MIEDVRAWLGLPPGAAESLVRLSDAGAPARGFELPSREETKLLLHGLGVPAEAIGEIVDAMPSARRHPEAWWLLERLYYKLVDERGGFDPPWPAPFPTEDPLTRYFHLYVFLAAVADARRFHSEHGIPDDVSWATLGDVGLQVEWYRRQYGHGGFNGAFWLVQHFRGGIYRLGRLQFDFWTVTFDPGADVGFRQGDPALGVHIPAIGPLTPRACDESFERAREFFPRHFPDEIYRVATCSSWLLDEQLAEYLPPSSNIIRFQQRFMLSGDSQAGDEAVLGFVFGRQPSSLEDLPRGTALERAIVRHLEAGRHWQVRTGWLEL